MKGVGLINLLVIIFTNQLNQLQMNKEEIIAFIKANLKMLHQAESPEEIAQWIKDNPSMS